MSKRKTFAIRSTLAISANSTEPKLVRQAVAPAKRPQPTINLHMGAHGERLTWAGQTFDISGLSVKDAAVVRYDVVRVIFGKASADQMVATYSAAA